MSDLKIKDFRAGLDTRRSVLETSLGALIELENAHINQGGEIEKRKTFYQIAMPDGTFGAQSVGTSIVTFGSDDPAVSITAALAILNAAFSVSYQRLQHPAVLDGVEAYDVAKHDLEEILHSTVFGTAAFAIARFSDDQVFAYYDGEVMRDFFAGEILNYLANNNVVLAKNIVTLVNEQGDYTAAQTTFATTQRARAANVATLTLASTTGLVSGQSVKVTGLPAAYNTTLATLLSVTSTQITYANAGGDEGTTADVAGTVTSSLITISGEKGAGFNIATLEDADNGSFGTPTTTVLPVVGQTGVSAVGSFRVTGGRVGGAASATLTSDNTQPAAAATVTIGTKVYTFVAALTNTEGQVLISPVNADATMQNLIEAINHGTAAGSQYYCAQAHPDVEAGALSAHAFTVVAKIGGTAGNAIAIAETSNHLSWSGAGFLTGGTASGGSNTISSIVVKSPAGATTELLQYPVEFVSNPFDTAEALVTAINNFTGTSGYTAELSGQNQVNVYSLVTANPQPNNYDLVVTANGNVCCGDCYFYFNIPSPSSGTVTSIIVDGVDVLIGEINYPSISPKTLTHLYQLIETQINAKTTAGVAHGILACAHAGYMQLSKRVTSSSDAIAVVNVNSTGGTAVFVDVNPSIPPNIENGLFVALSSDGTANTLRNVNIDQGNGTYPSVTAIATGGEEPYSYRWANAYDYYLDVVQDSGQLRPAMSTDAIIKYTSDRPQTVGEAVAIVQVVGATLPTASFNMTYNNSRNNDGRAYTFAFRCEVTDALGVKALSGVFNYTIVFSS